MLKRFVYILISVIFIISLENNCYAIPVTTFSADSTITIIPFPISNPTPPKAPAVVPISASYESILTSVILAFSYDLGEIEVEVLNTISGFFNSGFIDTQFLSAVIPISGGPGHYIITFTLLSGQQYCGEFDI